MSFVVVHWTLADNLRDHLFHLMDCNLNDALSTWWHHLCKVLRWCYWTNFLDVVCEQAFGCEQRFARGSGVWTQLDAFAISSQPKVQMFSVRWPVSCSGVYKNLDYYILLRVRKVRRTINQDGKCYTKQNRGTLAVSDWTCRPRKCVFSSCCFAPPQKSENTA